MESTEQPVAKGSLLASFRAATSSLSETISLLAIIGFFAIGLLPSPRAPSSATADVNVLRPRPPIAQPETKLVTALPSPSPLVSEAVPVAEPADSTVSATHSPGEHVPSQAVAGLLPLIHTRPTQVIEVRARRKVRSTRRERSRRRGGEQARSEPIKDARDAPPATAAKEQAAPAPRSVVPPVPAASEPAKADANKAEASNKSEPAKAEVAPEEPPQWTDAEVAAALRTCLTTLAPLGIELETRPPVREKSCGLAAPIAVKQLASGVELRPAPVLNCGVAVALHEWLTKIAQPAAREVFGSPIVRLTGTGGYSCRNRNGAITGPISEHAFGNALDISGFVLADGRSVQVQEHWGAVARKQSPPAPAATKEAAKEGEPTEAAQGKKKMAGGALGSKKSALGGPAEAPGAEKPAPAAAKPDPLEGKFLRRAHAGACKYFGTVLGPEANDAHLNHLHFDLKPRRRNNFCQ